MIQEIMEKANQLYTGFVVAPVEYQVAIGIGVLVVIAALKSIWSVLYPVRWTAASLLRVTAFLMHPRKRKVKTTEAVDDVSKSVPFDFSTKEKAQAAYTFYAGTDAVQMLSDEQMKVISEAIDVYRLEGHGGLTTENERRKMQKRIAALQVTAEPVAQIDTSTLEARITELEAERVTVAPKLVEKAMPSKADVI